MDILKNKNVTHKKYGDGNIVEVNDNIVIIKFAEFGDTKKFVYPNSFDGYMVFENSDLQENAIRVIEMEKAKKRVEGELKKQEYEKQVEERRIEKNEKLKKQRKAAKAKSDREKALKLKKEEIGEEHAVRL